MNSLSAWNLVGASSKIINLIMEVKSLAPTAIPVTARIDVVVYHYCYDKNLIEPQTSIVVMYEMFTGPQSFEISKMTASPY
jgi:hypothetical protein